MALGDLVLRDACREGGLRFVVGSAILSLIIFTACAAGIAHWWAFLSIGIGAIGSAGLVRNGLTSGPRPKAGPLLPYRQILIAVFGIYFLLYLSHAMAPEASPDGAGYHLSLVARYLEAHGFVRITDNFYAAFPAAIEMLFLHAFAFGRHSAAALVHLTFLIALTWQIYVYAPRAGFAAALLVFASPVVGM